MKRKSSAHPIRYAVLGILAVLVINLIGAAIITTCILKDWLSTKAPVYFAPAMLFMTMMICALIVIKSVGVNRGIVLSLLMAAVVLIILAAFNFILFDGEFGGILPILSATIVGGACGILGAVFKLKRTKRKKRYR